jgi:hypothetical protein
MKITTKGQSYQVFLSYRFLVSFFGVIALSLVLDSVQ